MQSGEEEQSSEEAELIGVRQSDEQGRFGAKVKAERASDQEADEDCIGRKDFPPLSKLHR